MKTILLIFAALASGTVSAKALLLNGRFTGKNSYGANVVMQFAEIQNRGSFALITACSGLAECEAVRKTEEYDVNKKTRVAGFDFVVTKEIYRRLSQVSLSGVSRNRRAFPAFEISYDHPTADQIEVTTSSENLVLRRE